MEMLVGTGWWDGIKAVTGLKSPTIDPNRKASETQASRKTRRARNARAATKSPPFCHPPRLGADDLTPEKQAAVRKKRKSVTNEPAFLHCSKLWIC